MSDSSKKMTNDDLQQQVRGVVEDSIDYVETELTPLRAIATDYYNAEKLGNEEEGRSQFVVSEVRDGVVGVIPSVLRVMFGAEKAVEFVPSNMKTVEQAEQATEVIHHDFVETNGGFMQSLSVLKDGLIRKLGIFKYWWDSTPSVTAHKLENVTENDIMLMMEDEQFTLLRVTGKTPAQPAQKLLVGPDGSEVGEGNPGVEATYDIEFTLTENDGLARFEAIPPEEFIYNREARSLADAMFVGHQTRKPRGELIAMGIDEKVLEEHGGDSTELRDNEEEIAREGGATQEDPEAGEENDKILYIEGYHRIDFDGDGIAELRKICTIGPNHHIVSNDPVDEPPFATFCPDPEPHTMTGQSWADRLMDLQKVKSMLTRTTLDSLSLSIFPRMSYVEGQVNPNDILNTEIGAPIRTRAVGMVNPITTPFVGKEAFPMFEYFDNITERRIGRMSNGAALNTDALQSSTRQAVGAAINSAQEQTELVARIFAEMTLKPLFRGLYKLYVEHKPKARTLRMRGVWAEIDPRTWDANLDVTVNVAIGAGSSEERVATLAELGAEQKEVIATLGPSNPIYSLAQFANTRKQILKLRGIKDTRPYINDVDPNWQPPAPPAPQKTPEQVIAEAQLQIEQLRTQRELAIKEAELALKQQQAAKEHELKIRQMDIDAQLRKYEIDLKLNMELAANEIERESKQIDATLTALDTAATHDRADRAQEHEHAVTEHDQMMAQEAHEREMSAPQESPETTE